MSLRRTARAGNEIETAGLQSRSEREIEEWIERKGREMRRLIVVVSVFVLGALGPISGPAVGGDEESPETAVAEEAASTESQAEERPFAIPRASGEIAVDGVLDEGAWADALTLELAFETRPGENIDPPVRTEVFATYDDRALYFAFRAHDPEPGAIRAHLADRDSAWSDDFVGVVLDPFNDERRAFQFFANPLGVQMDSFVDDLGGGESDAWDAIWDSAGKITTTGYVVELAIPFNQLRFEAASGQQTWGFDALRFYPRDQRHRIALQPLDRSISCYVCQVSKLNGFEGITPGRNLEFVPTVTGGRTDVREDFPTGDLVEGSVDNEFGLTARWGITPNLILNAAINPDFSQVEADVAQLDVNNQFALFFPERRPFFLEGADFFSTPMRAVFTRNVADPDWGVKFSGKQGKNAFGAFVARDTTTNLLFPGSQGSDADSFDFETDDAVVRYRRDFGSSSAIGVLFTSREGGDYSNQVGGIDGLYRFRETDSIRFQYLRSETEYPGVIAADFDQPSGSFSDHGYRLRYTHDDRNWFVYGEYRDIGSQFRADMGFMPRVGTSFLLAGADRTWWGEEDDWYTRWSFGGDWDLTEDEEGNVLEREAEIRTNISGPKQSHLFFGIGQRDRFFDGVIFEDQDFMNSWFEIQPTGDFWFGMFAGRGDAIDFAHTRPAKVLFLEPSIQWNLGLHLRANLDHNLQRLDVDGGELFEANLSQLRLVYQFNVRTFVRTIFQWTSIDRNQALYQDEVDAEFDRLFTQVLFSYKLNPQTVLFLGYGDTREGDQRISLTQSDRSVFLKLGYAWVL